MFNAPTSAATSSQDAYFALPHPAYFFLEDVSVNFPGINALKSVHLEIQRGEIVFLTGASGAGKTTLLRLLAGELNPSAGRLVRPEQAFITQVFQDLRLFPQRTIEQNLSYAYDAQIYARPEDFKRDMHDLAQALGVADRLGMKVKDANGGLKQKVAIMRALLAKPDVLLADEPTSSLDADSANQLFELLNLFNVRRQLTVVWASHNAELVKKFSGRILHLENGRLVYAGHACFI
ncbi:MAG: ATP-binding cassette domain-containing protein [Bacteriovoracaceae bacterium]|nr:ATP-binding cassette domain-containing protein [Bacteriovoracaceae bacterium]